MKRFFLGSLTLLLCVVMLFAFLPAEVNAASVVAQGECGTESTWVLDSDGTLTISGTGYAGSDYCDTSWYWYNVSSSIKKVVFESGITTIGSDSFSDYANLTTVVLPDTLEYISSYLFQGCTSLTSINIPGSVNEIGTSAFSGCTKLESVTIPDSVACIHTYAFYGCSSLKSISIPNSVTEIGYGAFRHCTALSNVTIPASVETLDSCVFADCTGLTSVSIPGSLSELPDATFEYCTGLTSVTIPSGIITLGGSVFEGCTALTSVTIPETVTKIGNAAFHGCSSLTEIKLPGSITEIGDSLFYNCTALKSITIPSGVTRIHDNAFYGCTSLSSVSIPNTVTTIGRSAFCNCDSLQALAIPGSVTYIFDYAFHNCDLLSNLDFLGNAPTMEENAFHYSTTRCYYPAGNSTWTSGVMQHYGGTLIWLESGTELGGKCGSRLTWSLSREGVLTVSGKGAMPDYNYDNPAPWDSARKWIRSVVIGSGVTRVGNFAFRYCDRLTSVSLPSTLKKIGSEAFYNCPLLTDVTLPSGLTEIGSDAFAFCGSLTSITIPKTVTTIGSSAFYQTGLKTITIPGSVTHLGGSAFADCEALQTASVPGSITGINWDTFANCTNLTKVTLGNGITFFEGGAFYNCVSLESITIPETVTAIGDSAFYNCESLAQITLPRNVTYLGGSAFKNCVSLVSINIPAGIRKLNAQTFYECASLEKVTFTGDAPESIDSEAFLNVYATVYYPSSNSTWKSSVRKDYGGELTWKTHSVSKVKITQQPTNVTVAAGKAAKVTVKATGEDLTYRWYYYVPGEGYKLTTSFTDNYYKVTMNASRNGREVYCVITDKYGNAVQTDYVTLRMAEETLEITQQPKGKAVAAGQTVKVTAKAEGKGLKYQWYVKDPGATKFTKSSITKSTYSVKMTAARSGRQVYCVITDSAGNKVQTDTVTISRITISKQPTNDCANSSEKVSTTVKATGSGLKYQWYIKDPGASKFVKSSVKKATYGYTMSKAKSGREAYCVITDKYGNSVTTDTVVFSRLAITQQPKSVTVASGKSAKVTVKATGESLKYTWYVKNPGSSKYTKSSVTKAAYSVTMTKSRAGRLVYCVITDIYGNSVKSNTVSLKLK